MNLYHPNIQRYLQTLDTRQIAKYIKHAIPDVENLKENEYLSVINFHPYNDRVDVKYKIYIQTDDDSELATNDLFEENDYEVMDEDVSYYDIVVGYNDIIQNTNIIVHLRKDKIKRLENEGF
jgi:hypothetical protein